MSITTRRLLVTGVVSLALAAGVTSSASAATGSASGSASVFFPAALKPHELCVSSATTGMICKDVPGVPAVTLTASFTADAALTAPTAGVAPCAGGAVVTVASGGGTLSGSATVSGLLLAPVTIPIGPTTTPGDTVTVSFCDKP